MTTHNVRVYKGGSGLWYAIIDGVRVGDDAEVSVHRCTGEFSCAALGHVGGTVTYTVTVPPPKPTFFEAGKTYERAYGKDTFAVDRIDTHPKTGVPYAHGWMTTRLPSGDYIRPSSLSDMGSWEEKR